MPRSTSPPRAVLPERSRADAFRRLGVRFGTGHVARNAGGTNASRTLRPPRSLPAPRSGRLRPAPSARRSLPPPCAARSACATRLRESPTRDRPALGGLRFSQFYNCALCGPSRAALMTGLPPHRAGITNWTGLLNQRCVTVCELLKRAGYTTAAAGRLDMVTAENWHDPAAIARHVDRFLGSTGHTGPGNYFQAVRGTDFFRDGQPFTPPAAGAYKTDLITDFAEQFITGAAGKDKPFFLYLAHYAPHWPLHAKPADIAKYRGLYRGLGWDAARAQRHERLIKLGLLPAGTKLPPRDARAPAWVDAQNKDWEA